MKKLTLIQKFSLLCFMALTFFGIGFGWIIVTSIEQSVITRAKQKTAKIISKNVRTHFDFKDLLTPKTGLDYDLFSDKLSHLSLGPNIESVKIWNMDKVVIWNEDRQLIGKRFSDNEELNEALNGEIVSEINLTDKSEHQFEKQFERVLELYVPIRFKTHGDIETVFEIYQNLDPLYVDIYQHKKIIWTSTALGFSFLYLVLFGIILGASRRIDAQTREITQSEEKYRTLVQSAQDGIISTDRSGSVILINDTALQMFGYKREELVGQPIIKLISENYKAKHQAGMNRFFETGKFSKAGKAIEFEGQRKDGQVFPIELSLSVSRETNIPTVTAMLRDVGERKAMQEQLINAEKQASASIIAGSIGHEINNVISGLMGYADLLKMKPDDEDLARKSAEIFSTQTERLRLHSNNLLTLSKPREPEMNQIDLSQFLDKCTEMLIVGGLLKRYTIIKEYSENLNPVLGDEVLLEQVVRNLEINAAHAMGDQGILTLCTRLSEDKSHIEFSINDTGHGISDDKRNQIFLPFYTTKEKGKGTGLGMFIVKQIIEKHKGYIRLNSKIGAGTTITIGLPSI